MIISIDTKKLIEVRKINDFKEPIKKYSNCLKISNHYQNISKIVLKVIYLFDNTTRKKNKFELLLDNLIKNLKSNNMLVWTTNNYKNSFYTLNNRLKAGWKLNDIDLSKQFNDLIKKMDLNVYISNPTKYYSISDFMYEPNKLIQFKIWYGRYGLRLCENDILYHVSLKKFNTLNGFHNANDGIVYSNKRIYFGLNMITDRYGSDVDPNSKEEVEEFRKQNKKINIYTVKPKENSLKIFYMDPELDIFTKIGEINSWFIGYVEKSKIENIKLI